MLPKRETWPNGSIVTWVLFSASLNHCPICSVAERLSRKQKGVGSIPAWGNFLFAKKTSTAFSGNSGDESWIRTPKIDATLPSRRYYPFRNLVNLDRPAMANHPCNTCVNRRRKLAARRRKRRERQRNRRAAELDTLDAERSQRDSTRKAILEAVTILQRIKQRILKIHFHSETEQTRSVITATGACYRKNPFRGSFLFVLSVIFTCNGFCTDGAGNKC
uniref:BZIP domain-containing protein n=1 Tax=Panagrellus redivivus TaxID=6233 RepID=A0A7E4W384_PANRE